MHWAELEQDSLSFKSSVIYLRELLLHTERTKPKKDKLLEYSKKVENLLKNVFREFQDIEKLRGQLCNSHLKSANVDDDINKYLEPFLLHAVEVCSRFSMMLDSALVRYQESSPYAFLDMGHSLIFYAITICSYILLPAGLKRKLTPLIEDNFRSAKPMTVGNRSMDGRYRQVLAIASPKLNIQPECGSVFADNRDIKSSEDVTITRQNLSIAFRKVLKKKTSDLPPLKWFKRLLQIINLQIVIPNFSTSASYFGGFDNGFDIGSDLDICIPLPHVSINNERRGRRQDDWHSQKENCHRLHELLLSSSFQNSQFIDDVRCRIVYIEVISARVPVVSCWLKTVYANNLFKQYQQSEVQTDSLNAETIKIDFVFDNLMGLLNTRLIRQYAGMHPNVKYLGQFVKLWARSREVSKPPKNLAPYGWILLVIFFLQRTQHLPSLQSLPTTDLLEQWGIDVKDIDPEMYNCQLKTPMDLYLDRNNVWWFDPFADRPLFSRIGDLFDRQRRALKCCSEIEPWKDPDGYCQSNYTSHISVDYSLDRTPKIRGNVKLTHIQSDGKEIPNAAWLKTSCSPASTTTTCQCDTSFNNFPAEPNRFHLSTLIFDFFNFYAFKFNIFRNVAAIREPSYRHVNQTEADHVTGNINQDDINAWIISKSPYRKHQAIFVDAVANTSLINQIQVVAHRIERQIVNHYSVQSDLAESKYDIDNKKKRSRCPSKKIVDDIFNNSKITKPFPQGLLTVEDPFEEAKFFQPRRAKNFDDEMAKTIQENICREIQLAADLMLCLEIGSDIPSCEQFIEEKLLCGRQ